MARKEEVKRGTKDHTTGTPGPKVVTLLAKATITGSRGINPEPRTAEVKRAAKVENIDLFPFQKDIVSNARARVALLKTAPMVHMK